MTVKELREVHQARPFQPFTLELTDGQKVDVPHPEFLMFSRRGRTVVVAGEDNAFKIVAASAPASVNGTVSTVNVSQLLPTESDPRPAIRRGLRLTGRS